MISVKRINAILLQEWHVSRRSLEVIMDIPFFAMIDVILFGVVSVYLSGSTESEAAHYLLLGAVFWEVIRITQYSMTVSSLWNVWSRNLSNMFISPLSLTEYFIAQMLSGLLKSVVIGLGLAVLVQWIFKFNIFALGSLTLLASGLNLIIFAWSIGIVLLGFIFRFGTRVQALGWACIYIFQPLSAAYVPVSAFPVPVQYVAYTLPSTYVFEALRLTLTTGQTPWMWQLIAFGLNVLYFIISIVIFQRLFTTSRTTGQFARNES